MPTAKALVEKHPLLTYFALTFAVSWGGFLAVSILGGAAGTPDQLDPRLAIEILMMLAGPSVAGILVTGVVRGKAGLSELLSRLLRWRVGAGWWAVALLAAPIGTAAVLFALTLGSPVFRPGVLESDHPGSLVLFGTAAGILVGVLEELGWTGFALPELRRRHSVVKAALALGVVWGAWHILPNAASASATYSGTLSPALFLVVRGLVCLVGGLPAFRVLMGWVYERTGSVLVAVIMHASLTASTLVFQPLAIAGTSLFIYDLTSIAAWWLIVAAIANGQESARVSRGARGNACGAAPVAASRSGIRSTAAWTSVRDPETRSGRGPTEGGEGQTVVYSGRMTRLSKKTSACQEENPNRSWPRPSRG